MPNPNSSMPATGFQHAAAQSMHGPYKIVRDIERPSQSVYDQLKKSGGDYPVAFAGPLALGSQIMLTPAIRPIRPNIRILGPAFTVKAHDHLIPMYAMQLAKPGDVLVIDADGWSNVCIWGGSMTHSAHLRQLGGVVVNGMVCDTCELIGPEISKKYDVPIFSLGPAGGSTTWEKPGSINVPVYIDGHQIDPGDLIVADNDGVAVIPKARISEAVKLSATFQSYIPAWHDPMNNEGKTWFEAIGLEPAIKKLGIPES